jgi:hypothetical protein
MNITLASRVAAHPVMVKLRARMEVMRRQMVRDYGHDFMDTSKDMEMNGRKTPRFEGVHFWTPAQRAEWFELETRMKNARTAIRGAYAAALVAA